MRAIRRMAKSGCRLTFSVQASFIPVVKAAFPGATIIDECTHKNGHQAIVMELP